MKTNNPDFEKYRKQVIQFSKLNDYAIFDLWDKLPSYCDFIYMIAIDALSEIQDKNPSLFLDLELSGDIDRFRKKMEFFWANANEEEA